MRTLLRLRVQGYRSVTTQDQQKGTGALLCASEKIGGFEMLGGLFANAGQDERIRMTALDAKNHPRQFQAKQYIQQKQRGKVEYIKATNLHIRRHHLKVMQNLINTSS